MLFAGFFLFLRIYNPTRLYLDITTCLAISIVISIFFYTHDLEKVPTLSWIISIVIFSIFSSVPYWISGTIGSVIQQFLLLNEQSVQDKRFIDETDSLAKISSLTFLIFALQNGALFRPIIDIITYSKDINLTINFQFLFYFIVDSLKMMMIVTGKYIIIMIIITISLGYIDLFFKKHLYHLLFRQILKR